VDEIMVGFLMYWHLPPATIYHISRLMIDAAYQGRGYGRGALELLIAVLYGLLQGKNWIVEERKQPPKGAVFRF
jgi:ribosomal protein S18 acetylase RimI-like enzyme